ncbi:MAG: sensor histidine kinase [Actinomycetota bacterium]
MTVAETDRAFAVPRGRGIGRRPHGIALRLLTAIVLVSSAVALLSTAVQLYLDYLRDIHQIEGRIDQIERSYLDSLGSSLWNVDVAQIRLQLEGLQRLPDMQALEVREEAPNLQSPLVVAVGERGQRAVMARTYPLVHLDRGVARRIGSLYVEATLAGVYDRLTDKIIVILATQGVKTFVVSLFILYIVHRLVTRHLFAIARYVGDYDIRRPSAALALHRRPPGRPDELDQVVTSFNGLRVSLEKAYEDLRSTNRALELDIVARREAEAEVTRLNAQLEQRVRQRTAELEAANAELGSFSYSVSHDLRAPLRRIEGFSRILIEEYSDRLDQRGIHLLDRMRAGANDLADMIDSFLRLSRSTRGELNVEPVDLSALAAEQVVQCADKEPDRRVAVEIEPGLLVNGDRRLLASALQNLMENAWKYTRRTEHPKVWFGTIERDGRTFYCVQDNGAGFAGEYAERLFTPFVRLHKSEDFEGIGIGLATVQRIVARHGGRVWAEGEPDKGASIGFSLWEGEGDEQQRQ